MTMRFCASKSTTWSFGKAFSFVGKSGTGKNYITYVFWPNASREILFDVVEFLDLGLFNGNVIKDGVEIRIMEILSVKSPKETSTMTKDASMTIFIKRNV